MKTKMISFIFLPIFVMTAVHCDPTDAKEFHCPCHPESPVLVPDENDLIVPQIEEPPTNSSDSESSDSGDSHNFNGELSYGFYLSQNRSLGNNYDTPNSFDYCSERLATLFGRYESNGMDSISMIEITPDVMYITTVDNERISVDYTVEFRYYYGGADNSTIRFERGGQTYRFKLVIPRDTTRIIGLMDGAMGLTKTQDYDATVTRIDYSLLITGGTN